MSSSTTRRQQQQQRRRTSDARVAHALWAAETTRLLAVLRDHLFARSLSDDVEQTPEYIMEVVDAARAQMLVAGGGGGGEGGAVWRAEVDAAWDVLVENVLGVQNGVTAEQAMDTLVFAVEEEGALDVAPFDDEDDGVVEDRDGVEDVPAPLPVTTTESGPLEQRKAPNLEPLGDIKFFDLGARDRPALDLEVDFQGLRLGAIAPSNRPIVVGIAIVDLELEEEEGTAASSSRGKARAARCVLCLDDLDDLQQTPAPAAMPCGHRFHPSCLRELVRKATEDESLFPPRCCDRRPGAAAIPYDAFGALLAPDEVRAYEDRKREFGTPAGERVYCSAPACGAFVGRKSAGEPPRAVPCVREGCGARTCDACGGAPHAWHVACSGGRDEGERALLALGREREWQRCPHCRRIVEKSGGCVHMMCWCGGEFCYRCGGGYHDGPCEEPVDVSVTRAALEAE